MAMTINTETKTFTFRDGQEILLKEPTLLQMMSAQSKAKDDLGVAKYLLVDMSNGELDMETINSLPFGEFKRLCEVVAEFASINPKD